MAIFYFINQIVAAETIEGGKLFKGGNYSRKYGIHLWICSKFMSLHFPAKASFSTIKKIL